MPASTIRVPRPGLALLVLVALGFPAVARVCSAADPQDSPGHRAPQAAEDAAPDTMVLATAPQPAPDFLLPDTDGVPHRFLGDAGRLHLLVYWSPECPECVHEMPHLAKLYARDRSRGLVVVSVTYPRLRDEAAAFAREKALGFPVLLDTGGRVAKLYQVQNTPSVFLVQGGRVVYHHAGFDPAAPDSLGPAVEALLR
jgi:peroxiredoxin